MAYRLRFAISGLLMGLAAAAHSVQFAYEPVGLGWSAEEVEHASAVQMDTLADRAEKSSQIGCRAHCERLGRVFDRLTAEARTQTLRSATLQWSLLVVHLPGVSAMAMPNGRLLISETFVNEHLRSDDTLAFVLAHEMGHSILEHERQALTFAQLLLPRQIVRSVADMYVEIDYDASLLMAMEPVMQQGEFEADEMGLLLASAAGFEPDRQIAFIEKQCLDKAEREPIVATHPPACHRLRALEALLPLARRQLPLRLN